MQKQVVSAFLSCITYINIIQYPINLLLVLYYPKSFVFDLAKFMLRDLRIAAMFTIVALVSASQQENGRIFKKFQNDVAVAKVVARGTYYSVDYMDGLCEHLSYMYDGVVLKE